MSVNAQGGSIAIAMQYDKYRDGQTMPVRGTGTITFNEVPDANDAVTIGAITYTFKSTMTTANDIQIVAGDKRATAINLVRAMSGTGTSGTDYYTGTQAHLNATAEIDNLTDIVYITSRVYGTGANLTFTKSDADNSLTLSGSGTLTGNVKGGDPLSATGWIGFVSNPADADTIQIGSVTYNIVDDIGGVGTELIKRGTSLAATLSNILAVINGTGVAGTTHKAGTTTPNADVSCVNSNDRILKLTAKTAGAAGNSLSLVVSGTGMAVSASTLTGGQDAKAYVRSTLTFRNFRATDVDFGIQQQQSVYPFEITGDPVPDGAYKSMVMASGGFTFLPRFQELGWLLLAAIGSATTVNNTTYGVHTFKFKPGEVTYLPWFTVRKSVPGRGPVAGQGIVAFDSMVDSLRLTVAPGAPLESRIDMHSRLPELSNHPEGWTTTTEDYKSIGVTCKGSFLLPEVFGTRTVPSVAAAIELVNQLTGPREEAILFSYYLDDIIALTRMLSIRWTHKWDSPEMYQRSFGGLGANSWDPQPFVTETNGSDYAFSLTVQAPNNIPNTNIPYSLTVRANRAFWQPQGDVRLRPGNIVTQDWACTALKHPDTYVEFVLTNANTTGYTIPSEP